MQYLNLPTSLLRSPEIIGADPTQRATWLMLNTWCCEQENGGRIAGAENWGDRRWMQTCGVTKEEVHTECDLWHWNGEGLVVWSYPADKQAEVQAKREAGRKGGLSTPSSSASRTASTERKGREPSPSGKGREGNPPPPPPALGGWLRGSRWAGIDPDDAWRLAVVRKAWEKENK